MQGVSFSFQFPFIIVAAMLFFGCGEIDTGGLRSSNGSQGGMGNNYPIVFVHGFVGWGVGELGNVPYFGLFSGDIGKELESRGHKIVIVSLGSVSSNHDQACEFFAQLKGTRVDYGAYHSKKFGHERYGRDYTGRGFYPEWGELDENGKVKKIHIIGHSNGGRTARQVVEFLGNGSFEEAESGLEVSSPFLNPARPSYSDWVSSVTTLATSHNGTTFVDFLNTLTIGYLDQVAAFFSAMVGGFNMISFDLKLDQWGLKRKPSESWIKYISGVLKSNAWHTEDRSDHDMAVDGSIRFNSKVHAKKDVYYFSWGAKATSEVNFGRHVPVIGRDGVNPLLLLSAVYMGQHISRKQRDLGLDEKWYANDGTVNVISMTGPFMGSNDEIVEYSGTPQIGKWNFMGILENVDHLTIVGVNPRHTRFGNRSLVDWYEKHVQMLKTL
ncbi:MAG: lipase [Oligoflexales bacterium]|nr:lipase [Oligoflexales bacterium]